MNDAARVELASRSTSLRRLRLLLPRHWLRGGRRALPRALTEASALLLPIVLVGATHGAGLALWLTAATYAALHVWLALRTARVARIRAAYLAWSTVRGLVAVGMVAVGQLLTGVPDALAVVYLPIVALAAFAGRVPLAAITLATIACGVAVDTIAHGSLAAALREAVGFAAAALVVAAGTRLEVRRMRSARDRLRQAVTADRRRARQIAGVEAIGRILAAEGPTPSALQSMVGRIASEFGYTYVSLYLGDATVVHLGAQRGYVDLVPTFDGTRGVVGRVMRTRQAAFVPDVTLDPDYVGVRDDVRSEICVPLLAEGEFLGLLNVESSAADPLDRTDLQVMVAIADRLAAALIIGRERHQLSERVELFRHLHDFSEAINGTLEPEQLYATVVRTVPSVVGADIVSLVILDRVSGRYFLRAVDGTDEAQLGMEFRPGEGMAGRAIRDRTLVIDPGYAPAAYPSSASYLNNLDRRPPMQAAAVPLIRDRAVVGAISILRRDVERPFTDLDRDAMSMVAEQAAMAVANAFLHADVQDLAVRDPLTGLFNRRYLDPALEQLFAQRQRIPEDERPPLAAIMFDLDHFSELNNQYGHQAGDAVLREFGSLLRRRMRSTDLVARIGGEEFAAILFRAGVDDAMRVAEEVRAQFAEGRIVGPGAEELAATVSAGCAEASAAADTAEELLRAADVALYMAKRAGRDRVVAA